MRFLKGALAVIFASIAAVELFLVFRPEPSILTAGVALGEAPFTDVLRKRFPIGSPASALEAELKQEGYWGSIRVDRIGRTERFWHYVKYERRAGLLTPRITVIGWQVDDDGRLTDLKGNKWMDLPVP